MTRDEIKAEIERRTKTMEHFMFSDLHLGLPDEAYRIADAYLQKLRRRGEATFRREGSRVVWTRPAS